jgi:hypothetical protein
MITDSRKRRLSNKEIIETSAKETNSPYTPEQVYAAVIAEAHGPNTIVIREGNTLFIINYDPDDHSQGFFRALNADTASNYLKNSIIFVHAAGAMGFKLLVTQFKDRNLITLFKGLMRKPPFKNMSYTRAETQDGGYRVTLHMGDIPKKEQ